MSELVFVNALFHFHPPLEIIDANLIATDYRSNWLPRFPYSCPALREWLPRSSVGHIYSNLD